MTLTKRQMIPIAMSLLLAPGLLSCGNNGGDGDEAFEPAPHGTRTVPSVVEPELPELEVYTRDDGRREVEIHENALFEFDSAEITSQGDATLDAVIDALGSTEGAVEVIGHTDTCGSAEYNQGLSERRAQAVVDGLVSKGMDRSRFEARGMGEAEAQATGPTEPCNQPEQRRVEVIFS